MLVRVFIGSLIGRSPGMKTFGRTRGPSCHTPPTAAHPPGNSFSGLNTAMPGSVNLNDAAGAGISSAKIVHPQARRSSRTSTAIHNPKLGLKVDRNIAAAGRDRADAAARWRRSSRFVPARNSCKLLIPSWSGSHAAHDGCSWWCRLPPKCACRRASEMPSPTVSITVTTTPADNSEVSPAKSVAVAVMIFPPAPVNQR